ncbi:D-alanyl-lipoteichoic acid biosynthesis protein DltD [Flavobacterium terrisoli]|uniref:D-alanyl-lipoteichoic acid biosynthesis protein DltD n=1 Tax=Flavobacterium terrisoli TaxID=3242195 RepID=UPI002542CA65|nr:D-alanyl-lipoteichoic acid biosynthesis protein DltD [Flavobacterium buctense]
MKKFIKYLIYFALPFIAIVAFFEIYLRQIDTTYTEKEKEILQDQKKIEVLILGNSRATLGIDPNQFEVHAFNLANVAQPLYYDKRIALKHLDKLTNLKYVFITVDATSLNYSRMDSRAIWSYYGNGVEYENEMPFLSKWSYLEGYSASIAIHLLKNDISGKFKTIKAIDLDDEHKLDMPIKKGFFTYKNSREEGMSPEHILVRANQGKDDGDSPEKKEIVNDLEDFIKTLKAKNITPILITMPCYEDYVKMLHKNVIKRSESDFKNLAEKFNLEYWNYLNHPMKRTDFHDCDHLNINGAVKFSKVLNDRLKEKMKADKLLSGNK